MMRRRRRKLMMIVIVMITLPVKVQVRDDIHKEIDYFKLKIVEMMGDI